MHSWFLSEIEGHMLSLLSISSSYVAPAPVLMRSALTGRAAEPTMQLQKKVRGDHLRAFS